MLLALHLAYLDYVLVGCAVAISVLGGALTGFRIHWWLDDRGVQLPPDTGAWVGAVVAALLLAGGVL